MRYREYQLGEGKLIYVPNWLDDPDRIHKDAQQTLTLTPEVVTMYGKTNLIDRQTVDYGLPYSYNKTAKPSIEWEPLALDIKQRLEHEMKIQLPQCAVNRYPDGDAYIGAHHDKHTVVGGYRCEPQYIVSVSTGAQRTMVLIPNGVTMTAPTVNSMSRLRDAITIELEPGSLVIFSNIVNRYWKHAVPKDGTVTEDRISLTYRKF